MPDYLNRAAAAEHIARRLGRPFTKAALEQHASRGTGPKYVMALGQASYTREWLDQWIEGLIEAPRKRPAAARQPHAAA